MELEWSKREAVNGCSSCWKKPDQVAVIRFGGSIARFCIDCLGELESAAVSLIDSYDGYDEDE